MNETIETPRGNKIPEKTGATPRDNNADDVLPDPWLISDAYLYTDEGNYVICADEMVAAGGQSQLYRARRIGDTDTNSELLAKVYNDFTNTDYVNHEAVANFLFEQQRTKEISDTHLLPLYATGQIYTQKGQFFVVDIIPYCQSGSFNGRRFTYTELKDQIIPSVLTAFNLLHKEHLVHRDIKPDNLYMLNGTVVVGDFGTTSQVSPINGVGATRAIRQTPGYSNANEMIRFTNAVDYFSLGCTIATLYNGHHIYEAELTEDPMLFLNALMDKGMPLNCHSGDEPLQVLVDALTILEPKQRPGYDDVKNWLDAPTAWRWRHNIRDDFSYEFHHKKYNTPEALTSAFLHNWTEAKAELYRGGRNNSNFVFIVRNNNATHIFDETMNEISKVFTERDNDKSFNEDLGFAKILHFLNTDWNKGADCPFYWHKYSFEKLSDISRKMNEDPDCKYALAELLKSGFISWKAERTSKYNDTELIKAISDIEDVTRAYPELGYYQFMYLFAPEGLFSFETADDIFKQLAAGERNFFTNADRALKSDQALAALSIGRNVNVRNYRDELEKYKNDYLAQITLIYKLFEDLCENKKPVRKHFYEYGPYSYLFWMKDHLDLYIFAKKDIQQKNIFSEITFDQSLPIDTFLTSREKRDMEASYSYIYNGFQNDILLAYMQIDAGKSITSESTDAYFVDWFYGISVPVGFLKHIGIDSPATKAFSGNDFLGVKK